MYIQIALPMHKEQKKVGVEIQPILALAKPYTGTTSLLLILRDTTVLRVAP